MSEPTGYSAETVTVAFPFAISTVSEPITFPFAISAVSQPITIQPVSAVPIVWYDHSPLLLHEQP